MAYVIELRTSKFDPAAEPPNRINPIAGRSILEWLRQHVVPDATEPDCEDWGWYMEVTFEGANYLIGGACVDAEADSVDQMRTWMIQIHKHRSLTDRLFGRNKIQAGDRLAAKIVAALRSDPGFVQVQGTNGA